MTTPHKPKTEADVRTERALEMGNRHASPIIRSMYPSKSRGDMAREFAQLYSLGFQDALRHSPTVLALVEALLKSREADAGNIHYYDFQLLRAIALDKYKEEIRE